MDFKLKADFKPTGDQPQAIESLLRGLENDETHQVLLGVTGSGKTFTMANVINKANKPSLIICHNKTLAAQLYGELKSFFPENYAVETWLWVPFAIWNVSAFTYGWMQDLMPDGDSMGSGE